MYLVLFASCKAQAGGQTSGPLLTGPGGVPLAASSASLPFPGVPPRLPLFSTLSQAPQACSGLKHRFKPNQRANRVPLGHLKMPRCLADLRVPHCLGLPMWRQLPPAVPAVSQGRRAQDGLEGSGGGGCILQEDPSLACPESAGPTILLNSCASCWISCARAPGEGVLPSSLARQGARAP